MAVRTPSGMGKKMLVSMPDSYMTAFIHLAIVLDVTGPCGALVLTHSFSSAEPDRKAALALKRFLMASIGHNRKFRNFFIEMDIQGLDHCVLRGNEKRTLTSEKEIISDPSPLFPPPS